MGVRAVFYPSLVKDLLNSLSFFSLWGELCEEGFFYRIVKLLFICGKSGTYEEVVLDGKFCKIKDRSQQAMTKERQPLEQP